MNVSPISHSFSCDSGIGEATAKLLAKQGARVVLVARSQDKLESICSEITAQGGVASFYTVDLGDAVAAKEFVEIFKNKYGTPDIIVNNAGAGRWLFIEETSNQDALDMMKAPCPFDLPFPFTHHSLTHSFLILFFSVFCMFLKTWLRFM
jgi:short-subunit dehydrogenase involved in D-alanine esterification of teichoic acids